MHKHILIGIAALLIAPPAIAQTTINIAEPASGTGYTFADSVVTITANGSYTITGTSSANRVVIAAGVTATVTLQDCSITSSTGSPFALDTSNCEVTLRIMGANTLTTTFTAGDDGHAGLEAEGSTARLIISGNGSLVATGSNYGAGIGGRLISGQARGGRPGNIIINGGTITANGGYQSAGIGGGNECNGGNITINGGVVTAMGGSSGAGIGGGFHGTGGNITVTGGYVTATGGAMSAAIGGGLYGSGGTMTITGGVVMAIHPGGQFDPPGIGNGSYSEHPGNITITGGSVFAYSGTGAGIGASGVTTTAGNGHITITGGSVFANTIGVTKGVANTPTSVTNGAIIVGSINATDFGGAKVQTDVSLPLEMLQALAANAGALYAAARRDTTVYDTTHVPVTIVDTTRVDTLIVDTTRRDTLIVDTTRVDTTIVDTLHRDSIIYDSIYHRDSIIYDIERRDSIAYDTIYHRDSIVIDTLYVTDTTRLDTLIVDTTHVNVYDTTRTTVDITDTLLTIVEIVDTALVPETLFVYDTIIEEREVQVSVYIVIDPIAATQTVVSEDARAVDGANGVMLEGLTPGAPYAVYSVTGALVVHSTALTTGTALLQDLSPGPYLLWHVGRWTKFTHR